MVGSRYWSSFEVLRPRSAWDCASANLHAGRKMAGRSPAVEAFHEERRAAPPAPGGTGLEFVGGAGEAGEWQPADIDDRAVAHFARPVRGRDAGEHVPLGGEIVARV